MHCSRDRQRTGPGERMLGEKTLTRLVVTNSLVTKSKWVTILSHFLGSQRGDGEWETKRERQWDRGWDWPNQSGLLRTFSEESCWSPEDVWLNLDSHFFSLLGLTLAGPKGRDVFLPGRRLGEGFAVMPHWHCLFNASCQISYFVNCLCKLWSDVLMLDISWCYTPMPYQIELMLFLCNTFFSKFL